MYKAIENFQPAKPFLVCIDSDGCAIDSMEVKHRECFGPLIVEHWALQEEQTEFLKRWNDINLYTSTRGINRFKGLAKILKACDIPGWQVIDEWVQRASSLSNDALVNETAPELQKVLAWSEAVNRAIRSLPQAKSFPGVKTTLEQLAQVADIAIVSSANIAAIREEWESNGLLDHVSVILSQNDGTKSAGISKLLHKGYALPSVLMVGDAPGDWQAAKDNAIAFYPILAGDEARSWAAFKTDVIGSFLCGIYNEQLYLKPFMEKLELGT